MERTKAAEAFFSRLAGEGLSDKQLFARILQDPEAFENAASCRKLQALIPELQILEVNQPGKDPNIYRPMPVMQHMLEAVRQAFGWVSSFGREEYTSACARRYALLWINTALLFHDQGEIAILKGTHLPLWYRFSVEWTKKRRKSILRETYPFFGMDSPEGRSYINHLRHPEISAALAADSLLRLGWDAGAVKVVQFLIRNHSVLIEKATYGRLKDGRTLHRDLYDEIASVHRETGVSREDLLKMLQVVQIMDAQAVKPGRAQIPQETMMRVWMAYNYMNIVLTARSSDQRCAAFNSYLKTFSQIRRESPFGTPFRESFQELLCRINEKGGSPCEEDCKLLEQELEYFERFEIIREDHIHINNQFNQLLHLVERTAGKELSEKEKAVLLQAYKMAYRSHDGQFRRAFKVVPTGDKRRKYIEHPIKVAKIMVRSFGATDPLILAAVLFHDVLEDTDIDVEDILSAFQSDDMKGHIIAALAILTKPSVRKPSEGKLQKDLAYLRYMAKILTAGDRVLNDPELFEWLRFVLPRAKAADKMHNRRSLKARTPQGRIKEICRNENSLTMLMEASNLSSEEKLKVLKEFDRSFFDIFNLLDTEKVEHLETFQNSFSEFRRSFNERPWKAAARTARQQEAIREFESRLELLPRYTGNVNALVEQLKDIERELPLFCREIGLNDRQTSYVLDAFALFLFRVSEVQWIGDEDKLKIIHFQAVIRSYKAKAAIGSWKPPLAETIESLERYAHGCENARTPIVRFGILPDLFDLLSRIPLVHRCYDRFLAMKKRELVARLLPRVAMLPIKNIYWLEGDKIKSVSRDRVEKEIGGLSVTDRAGRFAIKMHPFPMRGRLRRILPRRSQ